MNNASPESKVVTQIRVRALVFLVLAVVAGGAAVLLFKQYLDRIRTSSAAAPVTTQPVVVAAMDIPIAARLEAKHVEVVNWPKAYAPQGSHAKVEDVVDHTLRTGVVKGEPILEDRLADEKEGRGLAALLAEGMRAMAVNVDAAVGVAGFVQPGDYVDVITTMAPDEDPDANRLAAKDVRVSKVSKIILQNILVLAVGEHLTTEGNKAMQVKVVTLGVTPDESEKLALASQHGRLTLTMRARIDQKLAVTAGISPLELLRPDEGSGDPNKQLVEPVVPRQTLRTAPFAGTRRRRAEQPVIEVKPAAPPIAPIVEILRGGKVEERKLRVPDAPAQ